jgi:hypothetical protein
MVCEAVMDCRLYAGVTIIRGVWTGVEMVFSLSLLAQPRYSLIFDAGMYAVECTLMSDRAGVRLNSKS